MMKDSWIHELNRISSVSESFSSDLTPLSNELNAFLKNCTVTGEMKNLLDDLNEYDLNRKAENIEYRAQGNIMTIKYSQPTVQEYRYFDVKWFCPIFFK